MAAIKFLSLYAACILDLKKKRKEKNWQLLNIEEFCYSSIQV